MKTKIYCCCNKASDKECDSCDKHKSLKPFRTFNIPTWKKVKYEPNK